MFTGLQPGHYRVATLVGVELGAWYDAEVLRQIDAARQTILNLRVPCRRLAHDDRGQRESLRARPQDLGVHSTSLLTDVANPRHAREKRFTAVDSVPTGEL